MGLRTEMKRVSGLLFLISFPMGQLSLAEKLDSDEILKQAVQNAAFTNVKFEDVVKKLREADVQICIERKPDDIVKRPGKA